eukprot:m.17228 g.17228  ORF g.17228 m.17228 type:complete len:1251 (+) comp7373_c0_seq2:165-3917(+)
MASADEYMEVQGDGENASYPINGLLPREETGASRVTDAVPEHDGRGVVVAVFDTGVDPGALHLRKTTTGQPKIIDVIDTTGGGDVDMSKVVQLNDQRQLIGITGRTLTVPEDWQSPSGDYRLGIKNIFQLFPTPLVKRVKAKRLELWSQKHAVVEAKHRQALTSFDAAHPSPSKEEMQERNELVKVLDAAVALKKDYNDLGPVYDVVMFHDGKEWKAAVDVSECGNLAESTLMGEYRFRQEYACFSDMDRMNYSFNVYNDGDILSIVTTSGSHGTHVAGIVGAYDPETGRSGVAPGCQIVSVKIGDSRVGSMETAAGLIRGVRAAVGAGCDLINLSFGEASSLCDIGQIIEAFQEGVDDKGLIFVSSAGNNGPALSTVGAPGGTSSCAISVGAYVSGSMMQASYSMAHQPPDAQYTWSSRGPAPNGDLGVCISAPGGAITDIPEYNLSGLQLMNGTSMSSPNACGGIALILSALKAMDVAYTPHSVKRALQNTASNLCGNTKFDSGYGVLQVDKAIEYLSRTNPQAAALPKLIVTASHPNSFQPKAQGIYLRHPACFTNPIQTASFSVTPAFHKDEKTQTMIDFELNLALSCDQTWVKVPSHFLLVNSARTVSIEVDVGSLQPGAHYAEIIALQVGKAAEGPVFRVPITVTKPHLLTPAPAQECAIEFKNLVFSAGHTERKFVASPPTATHATITLTPKGTIDVERRIALHTTQLQRNTAYNTNEYAKYIMFYSNSPSVHNIAIEGGSTMEVCIAQWWAHTPTTQLDVKVEFFSAKASPVSLHTNGSAQAMDIYCGFGTMKVSPKATLNELSTMLVPKTSFIAVTRDVRNTRFDAQQMHTLTMTFPFSLKSKLTVYPSFPEVSAFLYEGAFESQTWFIFDEGNQLVLNGDAFPQRYKKALPKGKYTLQYQIRHEKESVLQELSKRCVFLRCSIKDITLKVLQQAPGTTDSPPAQRAKSLLGGETLPVYVAPPRSGLPDIANPGDVLFGNVVLSSDASEKGTTSVAIRCTVGQSASPQQAPTAAAAEKKKQSLAAKIWQMKVKELESNPSDDPGADFDVLRSEMPEEEDALDVYLAYAKVLRKQQAKEDQQTVLTVCAEGIASVDVAKLATDLLLNPDPSDTAAEEGQKSAKALKQKLLSLLRIQLEACVDQVEAGQGGDDGLAALKQAFALASRWEKIEGSEDWCAVVARYYVLIGKLGHALSVLTKLSATKKARYTQANDIYAKLGWGELLLPGNLLVQFPPTSPLFVE